MAWTRVQHTFSDPVGALTNTLAFGSNVTSGHLLIVSVNNQTSTHTATVADSQGAYTQAVTNNSAAAGYGAIFYRLATATGANTVTVTWSLISVLPNISIEEWSGNAASAPLDKTASAVGTVTAVSSGATATLTNAAELAYGYIFSSGTLTAVGSGWTGAIDAPAGNDNIAQYQILAATTGIAATATEQSGTFTTVAMVATFLPAAGGTTSLGTAAIATKWGITPAPAVRVLLKSTIQFTIGISPAKLQDLMQAALVAHFGIANAPRIQSVLSSSIQFKAGVTTAQVKTMLKGAIVAHFGIVSASGAAPTLGGGGTGPVVGVSFYFTDGTGYHRIAPDS